MCKVYNVRISFVFTFIYVYSHKQVFFNTTCNISLLSGYYILGFGLEISESDDT